MKKDATKRGRDTDDLGSLIRMAGKPPSVPEDVAHRVREAVRDQWQNELRKRSLRRRVWTGAALSAAALLAFTIGPGLWRFARPPAAPESVARVSSIVHPVWALDALAHEPGERTESLGLGDGITAGLEIATEGKGAIAITMDTGHSVRLDTATRVRVLSGSLLELVEGAVYVDSSGLAGHAGETLGIRTPLGVVRDIGTQYLVRSSDEGIRIRVREGTVIVNGDAGNHHVTVGSELAVDATGSASITETPIYGPEWDWTERTAPMMDLEGRTLKVFLDWLSRERGYRLSYDDAETERAASTIVLSGSILGLTLHEALDAVLPTCGMTSRVVAGELRIAMSREDGA